MNMYTFSLDFCCILFWLFLAIVYFTKKNMSNLENSLYKYLIILNFLILMFCMVCLFSGNYIKSIPIMLSVYNICSRIYCVSQLVWFLSLIFYTILVIVDDKSKSIISIFTGNNKRAFNILVGIMLIIIAITFVLPVNYSYDSNGIVTTYGIQTYYMIVVLSLLDLIVTVCILINFSKIKNKKKLYPFILMVIMQVLSVFEKYMNNSIDLLPLTITLISYLMFHTIESPDLKLISELEVAKDKAELANKEKSGFLSSMSHELRTPLNAIIGLSELIDLSDDIEEIHENTKDIVRASDNLMELVNSILDINLLESGKMNLKEQVYNPLIMFEEVLEENKMKLNNKELEIRTNFSTDLPYQLYGDKDKLKRIIGNLITNGIKYTDKGYIDFIVDCTNNSGNCNLKILIRDTGRGIKEDQKKYLFTKFYRLEEYKDSDISGTGLGLAITKGLIDLFGGTITVDSTFGIGTTFIVNITQKINKEFELL